jgi:hypothetical protein
MKKQRRTDPGKPSKALRALVSRYKSTAADAAKSELSRQRLARDLIEIAMQNKQARIRIAEHNLAKPGSKPKVKEFLLSDPRAAALRLERFCNIKLPVPFWICAMACPIFIPFPLPPFIRFGFFLIFCDLNICSGIQTCYYITI